MTRHTVWTIVTVVASLALTVFTVITLKTWAGMYLPLTTSWVIAVLVCLIPGLLLNHRLTKSYKKIVPTAEESGSLFGSLFLCNVVIAIAVAVGLCGLPAQVACEETVTHSWATFGLLEQPLAATLPDYPRSITGTGVIWCPNLATVERPRVIARMNDGNLKAVYLPPRGKRLDAMEDVIVGVADPDRDGIVMLCPVQDGHIQILARWNKGMARFRFIPGGKLARAEFKKKTN